MAGLIALLRAAATGDGGLRLKSFDEDVVRWALDTGFGPLLYRAVADDADAIREPFWPLVHGANLTARLLTGLQIDAMTAIIDACRGHVAPPVLLKGISMCQRYYPAPHLRPMRDIDFLVDGADVPAVEAILTGLGYVQRSERPPAFYASHHHSEPFVHPDTGVWVDVHRALFAPTSELAEDRVFGLPNVMTQLEPGEFAGRPVRQLRDDLQLVHVACHWAHGLRVLGGMAAMADITYLLRTTPVRWELIIRWMEGSAGARHLGLLLTYLERHDLVDLPGDVIRWLRLEQGVLDRGTAALAHALLDRYVVGGRPFGRLVSETAFSRLWRIAILRRPPSRRFGLFPVPASRRAARQPSATPRQGGEVNAQPP
jgi:hypothetical protein